MLHRNNKHYFSKFLVLATFGFVIFSANISCVMANGEKPKPKCEGDIKVCLAEALGCKATDRSIRNALAPALATNYATTSAGSSLPLITGISKAQSAAP